MIYRLIHLSIILSLLSCTHSIHLVHTSGYTPYVNPKKAKIIRAKSEQFVVLGLAYNTDYVDKAYKILQKKCKNKNISGITTQFSTSHGFFSWTNKILLQGLCAG